jgi:hypothetical protein
VAGAAWVTIILQFISLFTYGGDIAVTAIDIVYSMLIGIIMPLQRLNQGDLPIIG